MVRLSKSGRRRSCSLSQQWVANFFGDFSSGSVFFWGGGAILISLHYPAALTICRCMLELLVMFTKLFVTNSFTIKPTSL